jgi:uncharacterized protein (TIGR02246 family)
VKKFILVFLGGSILSVFFGGCKKTELPINVKKELDEITSQLDIAWNNGDAVSFANLWTEDAINVNPMGGITEGLKNIEKSMAIEFSGSMKGTTHKLIIEKVYLVSSSVSVADGAAEVKVDNNEPWKSQFTAIFSRDKTGTWKIAHMRAYVFLSFN